MFSLIKVRIYVLKLYFRYVKGLKVCLNETAWVDSNCTTLVKLMTTLTYGCISFVILFVISLLVHVLALVVFSHLYACVTW